VRARQRLLRRIHARYRTVTETVSVGPLVFPFTRIADPDRVLDEVAAEEDRMEKVSGRRADGDYLHLPYWAELWDSASGMATHLVGQQAAGGPAGVVPFAAPGRPRALDLGCGMGLTGTVAAALGMPVLFADLEPPALLFARLNALPFSRRWLRRRPELSRRWFGVRRWAPLVRTRRVDWRRDRLGERFDLILGADILYERKQWEHLEPFWRAHLAPGGTVLLGEPGRPTGDAFPDWIAARGWNLRTESQPVATRPSPVRLFLLTLPTA
jgi:predicted nicotinamide N-methyase